MLLNVLRGNELFLLQEFDQLAQLLEGRLLPLQASLTADIAAIYMSDAHGIITVLAGKVGVYELAST